MLKPIEYILLKKREFAMPNPSLGISGPHNFSVLMLLQDNNEHLGRKTCNFIECYGSQYYHATFDIASTV